MNFNFGNFLLCLATVFAFSTFMAIAEVPLSLQYILSFALGFLWTPLTGHPIFENAKK